jgi:hypothetical protein
MTYQIIQPPFTLVFWEMSKKELKDYYEWFHKVMPDRIHILTSTVKSTLGYEHWKPDCSPESLELLDDWFFTQVETRLRSQTEIEEAEVQNQSKFPIKVPEDELTDKTFSMAMDIGMYLSQVFLKNHPTLQWSQEFKGKKSAYYGQPVLLGFGIVPCNPVSLLVTRAYRFSWKIKPEENLRDLYNIWSALIV